MPKKKPSEPEESAKNQELVRRVDKMMSTELPVEAPAKPVVMADEPDDEKPAEKKPAAKAPKDQKTAPELPSKMLKDTGDELVKKTETTPEAEEPEKVKVTKIETPAKPPIVITLADEDDEAKASDEQLEKPEEPVAEAEPPQTPTKDPLEDSATDKAVDDIVAHEGDTVLAVNDALTARKQATAEPGQPSGPPKSHKWFWIILLIILLGAGADTALFLLRR